MGSRWHRRHALLCTHQQSGVPSALSIIFIMAWVSSDALIAW